MTNSEAILDNRQETGHYIRDLQNTSLQNERFCARIIEALLFASQSPLAIDELQSRLPHGIVIDVLKIIRSLQAHYEGRGIEVIEINKKWLIRTAPDLSDYMVRDVVEHKKLSKSALETLGIIAYHQPVTRPEIENIRGVALSKGTLDHLMQIGWIRLGTRRETPGRPVTFVTTDNFLEHFGLKSIKDLPGIKELKDAGFLDSGGRALSDDELRILLDDDIEKKDNNDNLAMSFDFKEDEI